VVAPVVAATMSLEATVSTMLPVTSTTVIAHGMVTLHSTAVAAVVAALLAVTTVSTLRVARATTSVSSATSATIHLLIHLLFKETLQLRLYHVHRARQSELRFERRSDLGCEALLNRKHRVERVPSKSMRGHQRLG
jgi:hypothetical protein